MRLEAAGRQTPPGIAGLGPFLARTGLGGVSEPATPMVPASASSTSGHARVAPRDALRGPSRVERNGGARGNLPDPFSLTAGRGGRVAPRNLPALPRPAMLKLGNF